MAEKTLEHTSQQHEIEESRAYDPSIDIPLPDVDTSRHIRRAISFLKRSENESSISRELLNKQVLEKKNGYKYPHKKLYLEDLAKDGQLSESTRRKMESVTNEGFGIQDARLILWGKKEGSASQYDKVIFLDPGWTGTGDIYTEIAFDEGKTAVEVALETLPEGTLIVTTDGFFGQTDFVGDELNGKNGAVAKFSKKYEGKFSVIEYARWGDFLACDVLGLSTAKDKANTRFVGHSFAGAKAYWQAMLGYAPGLAFAPAEKCDEDELKIYFKKLSDQAIKDMGSYLEKIKPGTSGQTQNLSITKNASPIYALLKNSLSVGDAADSAMDPFLFGQAITGNLFKRLLGPVLMGKGLYGDIDPDVAETMSQQLEKLHGWELRTKSEKASLVMGELAKGSVVSRLTPDQLLAMAKVVPIFGFDDLLVTRHDVVQFQRALSFLATLHTLNVDLSEEDRKTAKEANKIILDRLEKIKQDEYEFEVKNAGHYGALYACFRPAMEELARMMKNEEQAFV